MLNRTATAGWMYYAGIAMPPNNRSAVTTKQLHGVFKDSHPWHRFHIIDPDMYTSSSVWGRSRGGLTIPFALCCLHVDAVHVTLWRYE
ncbi:hypothetical protein [Novipirellula sp.]|uniref:hypothetical protein n=1 Tax=Novipirellula sp. TaxID=2795430 RepID=UPI003563C194